MAVEKTAEQATGDTALGLALFFFQGDLQFRFEKKGTRANAQYKIQAPDKRRASEVQHPGRY